MSEEICTHCGGYGEYEVPVGEGLTAGYESTQCFVFRGRGLIEPSRFGQFAQNGVSAQEAADKAINVIKTGGDK
jgi:hypothetical protein